MNRFSEQLARVPVDPGVYIMRDAKGPSGYHLIVITQAKNDKIKSIADLKGKRVAHVSQTSSSGHQAPIYFFFISSSSTLRSHFADVCNAAPEYPDT